MFHECLKKIDIKDSNNQKLNPWAPRLILEYIQWNETIPDLIVDVSGFIDKKLEAIKAFKSQFFDPESKELSTPISSEIFLESISYRAANMGRLIFKNAGEGFTCQTPLSITDLGGLIS